MTMEEAIFVLESKRPQCGERVVFSESEICEAIDMAIEALQDRPTELLDDGTLLVKVPNAKSVGRVWIKDADENVHIGGGLYYLDDDRLTGEWIHDGVNVKGGVDWMHCSNCGKRDVWADATRTNYCPNCGARMKAR